MPVYVCVCVSKRECFWCFSVKYRISKLHLTYRVIEWIFVSFCRMHWLLRFRNRKLSGDIMATSNSNSNRKHTKKKHIYKRGDARAPAKIVVISQYIYRNSLEMQKKCVCVWVLQWNMELFVCRFDLIRFDNFFLYSFCCYSLDSSHIWTQRNEAIFVINLSEKFH